MQLISGTRLARYEIRSQIGAGGMGEVYLAQDSRLDRKVALKILPPDVANNQDRMRRFEQEAKSAAALNHPNIAHIYEIGEADGVNFIAMEFIDGQTLRECIHGGQTDLRKLLRYLQHVAEGLAKAHAAGIVHRDLKPDNIMLTGDGHAKILDFGLAKLIEPQDRVAVGGEGSSEVATAILEQHSKSGAILGTVGYMSPEQAQGKTKEIDHRSDIFSFGCILYEAVTGHKAFEGKDAIDSLNKIIREPVAPISGFRPEAPGELQKIVRRCLAKDPEERYQSIKDVAIELKELRRELESSAGFDTTVLPSRSPETSSQLSGEPAATQTLAPGSTQSVSAAAPASSAEYIVAQIKRHKLGALLAVGIIAAAALGAGLYLRSRNAPAAIESIAVMPFVNASGNAEVEYLSDGITESLINSLSQLPHLSVKARSSVFRYKGKEVEPQQVGSELSVQAILNGRVVQRGDDLTLYLSLVDARNGNQLWGEQYNRKLTDLVSLQSEIARDVSRKLRARLSGVEERKLAKNYTENVEAYQLYLKGRYHVLKLKPSEVNRGISLYQQAIENDPSYALAYVGLADAYRRLALAADMPSTEVFPKAKAAAQKAVEIDDNLAEAHAVLGFTIFWYDWDGNEAENQFRRALELNPNSADTLETYAHLLSNTGRHAEALAKIKRARELDPLSLRINALEGQFLIHAGQTDEALARLQKTSELDPNYWLAHLFASSAYIEKGMFAEAVAEAHKARELSGVSTHPIAFAGYALAKSGKQAEARSELEGLLKLSTERYVPAYNVALIYNGLGERDETLAWLERGFEQRDARLIFLKVEPKWNNLRSDPRFVDLLQRVGLAP